MKTKKIKEEIIKYLNKKRIKIVSWKIENEIKICGRSDSSYEESFLTGRSTITLHIWNPKIAGLWQEADKKLDKSL